MISVLRDIIPNNSRFKYYKAFNIFILMHRYAISEIQLIHGTSELGAGYKIPIRRGSNAFNGRKCSRILWEKVAKRLLM